MKRVMLGAASVLALSVAFGSMGVAKACDKNCTQQASNNQGGNSQGGNSQGGNSQGGNSQGGNSQGDNSQGGNSQGDNSQGGNSQGGNSQGGNSQGGNSQGGNSQGGNSQGENGNSQGENENGQGCNSQCSNSHDDKGKHDHDRDGKDEHGGRDHDRDGKDVHGGKDHDRDGKNEHAGKDHDRDGKDEHGGRDHDRDGKNEHGGRDHDRDGKNEHGGKDHDRDGKNWKTTWRHKHKHPTDPTDPTDPTGPTDPKTPEGSPVLEPAVVAPALASRLGLAMLGTSFNREGDAEICADEEEAPKADMYYKAMPTKAQPAVRRHAQCNTVLWGRVFGETGKVGGGDAAPGYNFTYGGFQIGADLYRTAFDNAGIYAGVASLQSNVMNANGGPAGRLGMDAYGVGGYWKHRVDSWYTEFVLQGNWYENIHAQQLAGPSFDTHGWGITASAETGYEFALGSGYSLIPQAQLVYQRTNLEGGLIVGQDGRISYSATDEIYGRLGTRLAKGWLTGDGRNVTTWAEANVWRQFGDDPRATFTYAGMTPTSVTTSLGGTWAQFALGVSGQVTRNVSLFGSLDYNVALSEDGHSLGGRTGVKVAW